MKTVTLTFTEEELGNLMTALDAGVRAQGVRMCRPLAPILAKLEEAAQAAQQEQAQENTDGAD